MINVRSLMPMRQIKLRLRTGRWVVPKVRIRTDEQLRILLENQDYADAYCGVTAWLNPTRIEDAHSIADKLPIASDLYVDIDEEDCEGGNSLCVALRIASFIKQKHPEYMLKRLVSSGHGHNLYYTEKGFRLHASINVRFAQLREQKTNFTAMLENEGFSVDPTTMKDVERVSRLEGSVRQDGSKCEVLWDSMVNGWEDVVRVRNNHLLRSGEPSQAMMRGRGSDFPPRSESLPQSPILSKGIGLYAYKYVSNMVPNCGGRELGTMSFVPFLLVKWLEQAQKVQSSYNLGVLWVIYQKDGYYGVLGVKKLAYTRLVKVLKAAGSSNLRTFQKFGQCRIISSEIATPTDMLQTQFSPPMLLEGDDLDASEISQEHLKLVQGEKNNLKKMVFLGSKHG